MGAQAFRILALEAAGPNAPEVLDLVEGEDNHVGLLFRPAFQPHSSPLQIHFTLLTSVKALAIRSR
jgi:hypothetical protein